MKVSNIKNNIINFLFAGVLTSNAIVNIFKQGGGVSNSIVMVVGGCVALILYLSRFKTIVRLKPEQVLVFFFLLFVLIFSMLFAPDHGKELVNRQFFFYILMGLGTLLITNYDYDFETVIKSIIIIALLLAPILLTGNFTDREGILEIDEKEEWMGYGYAIVTFIIADLFYLIVYKSKLWKFISLGTLILYSPSFFWHSSRGAFGAIMGFLILVIIQKTLLKGKSLRRSMKVAISIIIIAFIAFIAFDVETLIMDSGVNSLAKFFEEGDVSNGRNRLYAIAIEGFWNSPIWGNGVGSFGNYTIYPHNLFLQFMYEGGILLFSILTWVLILSVKYILSIKVDRNKSYLLLFVFSCSIFELLFSATYWEKPRFWLTIWITLAIFNEFKKHRRVFETNNPVSITNQFD